ncbi:hypothetical protein M422DRAFT_248393 [Sphaerobolus stellatus SS14]|uniref:Uncharacterized protein n=1 Tax=Sphaerobolus stellatus (strain SS14) TaxID=990650 RepID=A0A0C9VIP8_SPHS4|nr:hypothetical protein M422DRAFT_248393 [Sphaerobolus stellatus SS14]
MLAKNMLIHDEHYQACTASHQTSHKTSLEPEKTSSATCGCGQGTPKCNQTLVHSASLPAHGQTLSGLTPVPEDSHAGHSEFSIHYPSLDPSQDTEGTPTSTPNPLGSGGGPGGDDGDGGGRGPPGDGPPPLGGGPPPPDGVPPNGEPAPNLNPGPNSDPEGGDGGGPPDNSGDHSSDDDKDEALN